MTTTPTLTLITKYIPPLLSLQLLFGAQTYLTSNLTPSAYAYTREKASHAVSSRSLYWIVPTTDLDTHMHVVGLMMGTAGGMVAFRRTRLYGAGLTMLLAGMGVWSQWKGGFNYVLPIINFSLAAMMGWAEGRRMGRF